MSEQRDAAPTTGSRTPGGTRAGGGEQGRWHADSRAFMHVLSPELVLVDPVLASEARRLLPDPPDCLAPRHSRARIVEGGDRAPALCLRPGLVWVSGGSPATPFGSGFSNALAGTTSHAALRVAFANGLVGSLPRVVVVEEPRRARPSLVAIVAVLLVALGIGLPSFDLVPWSAAELPSFVADGQEGSGTTTAGDDDLRLAWSEAEDATLYNVVLWRGGRRVLDLWPETNHVDVDAAVRSSGKRLAAGTYEWFAIPGYDPRDDLRFGKALAHGAFTVDG